MGEYKHIFNIASPEYLKNKSMNDLYDISKEIREFIIDNVSEYGGHLSSNLGVVEATIALHYVFDSPHDKIIFDVGHQCYTHKILTGRAKDFVNFRTFEGCSGFPKYNESVHDVYEVGHSSTSIGAMIGFLEEKRKNDDIGEVISFIGDASLENGLALTALNYLSTRKDSKAIIIINDNEMSISKNVGGLTKLFNRIRISKKFRFVRKITSVNFRNKIKKMIYGDIHFFNELGYSYIGPVDGHNIKDLVEVLEYAKASPRSSIIHIKTKKGKGFELAENDNVGYYHAIGPFYKETGIQKKIVNNNEITFSNGISLILENIMKTNQNIKVITPAMTYGLGFTNISNTFKSRFIDCGINEELAVSIASGMARFNSIPIVCTYSSFLQRAYDEINHDVCRSDSHVIFLIDKAGIVNGDGNTHQGIFDVSMLTSLPNMIVASPSNLVEFTYLLEHAINTPHPFAIRYPKAITLRNYESKPIGFGEWNIFNEIKAINIVSYGPVMYEIYQEIKKQGLLDKIGLINALFIKPFDEKLIKSLSNKTLYVYEEVVSSGSLSDELINYVYLNNLNIKIKPINFTTYVDAGTIDEVRSRYLLSIKDLVKLASPDNK